MGRTTWRRDELLAEIEHLQLLGIPVESWPADLGISEAALARALYRAGERKLARPFARTLSRARDRRLSTTPCKVCGGPKRRTNLHYCSHRCYRADFKIT